jgi:hypothetical protein
MKPTDKDGVQNNHIGDEREGAGDHKNHAKDVVIGGGGGGNDGTGGLGTAHVSESMRMRTWSEFGALTRELWDRDYGLSHVVRVRNVVAPGLTFQSDFGIIPQQRWDQSGQESMKNPLHMRHRLSSFAKGGSWLARSRVSVFHNTDGLLLAAYRTEVGRRVLTNNHLRFGILLRNAEASRSESDRSSLTTSEIHAQWQGPYHAMRLLLTDNFVDSVRAKADQLSPSLGRPYASLNDNDLGLIGSATVGRGAFAVGAEVRGAKEEGVNALKSFEYNVGAEYSDGKHALTVQTTENRRKLHTALVRTWNLSSIHCDTNGDGSEVIRSGITTDLDRSWYASPNVHGGIAVEYALQHFDPKNRKPDTFFRVQGKLNTDGTLGGVVRMDKIPGPGITGMHLNMHTNVYSAKTHASLGFTIGDP